MLTRLQSLKMVRARDFDTQANTPDAAYPVEPSLVAEERTRGE